MAYAEIKFNPGSIFSSDRRKSITKTFNNLSDDFIHGLHVTHVNFNDSNNPIADITTNVHVNDVSDKYTIHRIDGILDDLEKDHDELGESKSLIDLLYTRHKIENVKRYAAIIPIVENDTLIIQFDSLDFISGMETYSSWIEMEDDTVYFRYVFDNLKECKMIKEYQWPVIDRKAKANEILNQFLIHDLVGIILEYFTVTCQYDENTIACRSEMDIIDQRRDGKTYHYKVYEDFQGKEVIRSYTDVDILCPVCHSYRYDILIGPFVCRVSVV